MYRVKSCSMYCKVENETSLSDDPGVSVCARVWWALNEFGVGQDPKRSQRWRRNYLSEKAYYFSFVRLLHSDQRCVREGASSPTQRRLGVFPLRAANNARRRKWVFVICVLGCRWVRTKNLVVTRIDQREKNKKKRKKGGQIITTI